jgi:hypothetical protein
MALAGWALVRCGSHNLHTEASYSFSPAKEDGNDK